MSSEQTKMITDPMASRPTRRFRLPRSWIKTGVARYIETTWRTLLLVLVGFAASALPAPGAGSAVPKLPLATPESVGMSSERLRAIDAIVAEGLRHHRMPGAVVLIAHHGKVVYLRAFGQRQLKPATVKMTTDTVFDMASITKPVATATSIMILAEQKQLDLQDPVTKFIPPFEAHGKDRITVQQLLTHQSGLMPDNAVADYANGPEEAIERICQLKLSAPPATKFIYSDVGYIVLAEIVRRVSHMNVAQFSQQHIFRPLGMNETGFCPRAELRRRAAPTEQREGHWMRGEVHDPRAYRLGGIAGHAGLFSTATDLAVYGQMMLGRGRYGDVRVLQPSTVERMTRAYPVPGGLRGLGWDVRTGYSSNRGDLFSPRAFGHGGFTGTSVWIDPQLDLLVIFLSNRVHPDGDGVVNPLAGRIGTVAAAAICCRPSATVGGAPMSTVKTGVDVLSETGFPPLRGRRVGLITNQTGISRDGLSTVKVLLRAPEVQLVAIFSPEHGFRGQLEQARIGDSRDQETGLPIFSLYGETRRPSPRSLKGIDTLVLDVQDIGSRFYTYISTMGYAMEAAAERQLKFVVLDRPNPINGVDFDGPVLDAGSESFVGYHRLPVRHGMTIGELARMYNAERHLELDLHVVELQGWRRDQFYDATGLLWINPSPNMRSLGQALLYPGIGLLETTNLSVGRGTDTPFEVIGAPWLDGQPLAAALNRSGLPGVRFVPIRFTPKARPFAAQPCGGVRIMVTNRRRFRPVHTGLTIAWQLRKLFPDDWDPTRWNVLLKSQPVYDALIEGKSVDQMEALYQTQLEAFRQRRDKFLLYGLRGTTDSRPSQTLRQ